MMKDELKSGTPAFHSSFIIPHSSFICVPVCEGRAIDLRGAVALAAEVADVIELRLDYLQNDELFKALPGLPSLIASSPRPVIVTLRPREQGGRRELGELARTMFWVEHFLYGKPHVGLADIELDLALLFMKREKEEGGEVLNWDRVICSQHFFDGTPADLSSVYERMAATPARVLKIAVTAQRITDCVELFRLLGRARREGREMIAVAMGEAGLLTRVLAPSRGALLTYGSSDPSKASAQGQVSARDLRDVYRVNSLDRETEVVGLVGSPVGHSLSPFVHNSAFRALGLNAVYIPFEVADLAAFMRRMAHPRTRELDWRLRGLSVTAPHKSSVMEHLDSLAPEAEEIGAVNTITAEGDSLRGHNTDAAGFLAPLRERNFTINGARCAVIGAGGAARSALWALGREGASVTLFARDLERARPVAEKFGASCRALEGASLDGFDLVVNATPLGTKGPREQETPAVAAQLRGAGLVYDLVYNPRDTRLQREAREAGCEALGGLSMLVAQAAQQFKLWTGLEAPVGVMSEAAESRF